MITAYYGNIKYHNLSWVEFIRLENDYIRENKWLIMEENLLSIEDLKKELINFKFNKHQLKILQKATYEEMEYCNKNNIPLTDGKIHFDGCWLFGNPTDYNCHSSIFDFHDKIEYIISYKTAFKIVRKHIHLIV